MKKWQALGSAAALLAALLLGGCSGQQAAATPEQAATPSPAATAEPTPVPAPAGNPLTGLDDADYTGKRPVAVMLRTLDGAQPQWGIASADVLIEGVTEGNTAGLMALFADVDRISKVGPVGPGRDLFLQAALPLNAMPVSIDKNVYAANLLNTLAYQDLDGYHVGKTAFAFDQGRQDAGYREENCWYTTGELIRNGAASYGTALEGSNTPLFRFGTREEVAPENRSGMSLTVTFSKSDSEQLNYNTGTGLYEKLNADGSPMTDADNGQQAAFTNVFVLYASSGIKDDGYTPPVRHDRRHRPLPARRRVGADLLEQGGRHRAVQPDRRRRHAADRGPGQELYRDLGRLLRPGPAPDRRRRQRADPARKARPAGKRRH